MTNITYAFLCKVNIKSNCRIQDTRLQRNSSVNTTFVSLVFPFIGKGWKIYKLALKQLTLLLCFQVLWNVWAHLSNKTMCFLIVTLWDSNMIVQSLLYYNWNTGNSVGSIRSPRKMCWINFNIITTNRFVSVRNAFSSILPFNVSRLVNLNKLTTVLMPIIFLGSTNI